MSPLYIFKSAWTRCDQLTALHAFLAANTTGVLQPDELLRAEWVARVSALDLYVHELVAQQMVASFEGTRVRSTAFNRFQVPNDVVHRIRNAATPVDAAAAFDLEVRTRLGALTYQDPEKIADGIRLISDKELWNEIAMASGATAASKSMVAKAIKQDLAAIVFRRNKIAHEGDLQQGVPRLPYPISVADLVDVSRKISDIVICMDRVIA